MMKNVDKNWKNPGRKKGFKAKKTNSNMKRDLKTKRSVIKF